MLKVVDAESTMSGPKENVDVDKSVQQGNKPTPATVESMEQTLADLFESREEHQDTLDWFSKKEQLTRTDITRLEAVIAAYDAVKDIDSQIVKAQLKWMNLKRKGSEEFKDHEYASEKFDAKMDVFGQVFDKVRAKFQEMSKTYPDNEVVQDLLKDFLPKENILPKDLIAGNKSVTSASGRGAEYAKNKLPKLKEDIKTKFDKFQFEFELGAERSVSLEELLDGVNILVKILDVDGKFEKLLREFEENEENAKVAEAFDVWKDDYVSKINKLKNTLTKAVQPTTEVSGKKDSTSFQAYFKKMSPPTFSGDCIDYLEWKTKWKSVVSICHQPPSIELDRIKENIPESAKKRLFDVRTLPQAWKVLDKLYGDKKLISQKLKNKMKNLKPVSKMPHEVIIELHEEVDYLVKRLVSLEIKDVLETDADYITAIYSHFPECYQLLWDEFEVEDYDSEWQAFQVFLEEKYETALKKRTRMESMKEMKKDISENKSGKKFKCYTCSEIGHTSKVCPNKAKIKEEKEKDKKVNIGKTDIEVNKEEKKSCPCCNGVHTWQPRNKPKPATSTRFSDCPKFKTMDVKERGDLLEQVKGCIQCLSWSHKREFCKIKASVATCSEKVDGGTCNKVHHKLLHGCEVPYCQVGKTSVRETSSINTEVDEHASTLMLLQDVPVGSEVARLEWDGGANKVLITNSFAEKAGLEKVASEYLMQVVGGEWKKVKGPMYSFDLKTNQGKKRKVWGYGIDKISDVVPAVDLSEIRHLFPHVPDKVFESLDEKPIDILMGLNFLGLHPEGGKGKDKVGNLRALTNEFSHGWVIGGSHPKLRPLKAKRNFQVSLMANINKIEIIPPVYKDFLELENLGVEPPKRCQKCKNCKFCSEEGLLLSCQEEEELKMINENVSVKDGKTKIKYPFVKDPNHLLDNRVSMLKRAQSLEKSLTRRKLRESYDEEFKKFIERGVISEVSKDELDSYSGPRNFISHHGVEQPGKITTPLRIVSNSSQENNGSSLNECLPKGPNCLSNLYRLLVRFRTHEVGLVFDLSKAYHTFHTSTVEKFLRLMIWRFKDEEEWKTYGYEKMAFGDKIAATALECGKKKAAEMGEEIDPLASEKICEEMYVDDGVSGGSQEEVKRLVGDKDTEGKFNGTIQQIFDLGGFRIKCFVWSGCDDEDSIALLGNSVLGYVWDAKTDMMAVKLKVNLSKKRRKISKNPDLTIKDLDKLRTIKLTKRNLLGFVTGIFDPLGISVPYTIKLKIEMKKLFDIDQNLAWDDEIPGHFTDWWVEVMTEAIKAEMLKFPRNTKPKYAEGLPMFIGFCDGSLSAYSAVVYVRWSMSEPKDEENKFSVSILCAKAKVTPTNGQTTPKSELNGATLLSRLLKSAVRASVDKPSQVICVGDSQCVIASLEMSSSKFKPFFMNRISEIRNNLEEIKSLCSVEEFQYISGKLNPADLATRKNGKLEIIGVNSEWQSPSFFKQDRENWPITRDFIKQDVPVEEMRRKNLVSFLAVKVNPTHAKLWDVIEEKCNYSDNMEKVLRILVRVLRGIELDFSIFKDENMLELFKNFKNESTEDPVSIYKQSKMTEIINKLAAPVTPEEMEKAEYLVMLHAMLITREDLEADKLTSLLPFEENGIIYTKGRVGEQALERILGVNKLPILSNKSRLAKLIMIRSHEEGTGMDHRGVASTLAKSRSRAWITNGRRLAKAVRNSCNLCKLRRRKPQSQQMALIRDEQLQPCPPFTHVALDYLGPLKVHDEVKKRVSLKVWVLVYCCRSTRAVCLLAVSGYSTDDFLVRHREFVSRHGTPQTLVSDRGTSLVKAGMILENASNPLANLDWKKIVASNRTTNWIFTEIGCQWRNGLSESMVKATKKCLKTAVPNDNELTYSELVTLLAEISYTINCRPIGVFGGNDQSDEIQPLTPNQLLLGRSSFDSKAPVYDLSTSLPKRVAYIRSLLDKWWTMWYQQVFPHLIPCKKWRTKGRNLEVGDVCLLYYPGALTGKYKLVRVVEVHPDPSGLVRTVTIKYKKRMKREKEHQISKKSMVHERVGVQRLILIQPMSEQMFRSTTPQQ